MCALRIHMLFVSKGSQIVTNTLINSLKIGWRVASFGQSTEANFQVLNYFKLQQPTQLKTGKENRRTYLNDAFYTLRANEVSNCQRNRPIYVMQI